jgi:hypothetical protein
MTHLGRKLIVVAAAATTLLGGPFKATLCAQTPLQRTADEGQDSGDLLGAPFESESAGISLRIPRGCQRIQSTNAGDDVGQFGDPRRKWELKITRIMRETKTSLAGTADNFGKPIPGLLEQTVTNLRRDLSGSTVLRQDLTNIADPGLGKTELVNNVGMIAIRYGTAGGHFLSQQAIIQASDRLFYLISLTNPVSDTQGPGVAPGDSERAAVQTFRQMLDSVRLLDTAAIRKDQDDRLIRTRRLLLELKNKARLRAVLAPEQWLRVMRNGQDIGYSYITEQQAAGVPKPLKAQEVFEGKNDSMKIEKGEGFLIGIRSRSIVPVEAVIDGSKPEAIKSKGRIQVDNATWLYVGPDQKLEDWSRITVVDDGTADKDGKAALRSIKEFGSSTVQTKTELDPSLLPGNKLDPKQPAAVIREHHRLDVTTITDTGASEPISQELPVFYLPQTTGHLLPRLLPLTRRSMDDVRSYMFANYVADTRQVMSRYVDVGDEGDFTFAGHSIHAIPVNDRLGWRGSVTTHYLTRDGRYLGSENKDTHTVIIPTDATTLLGIWRGKANLTPPGAVLRPGATPQRPGPAPQGDPALGPARPGQ